jgi:hypothetical protein
MTPQAINIAIAELCGKAVCRHDPSKWERRGTDGDSELYCVECNKYLGDMRVSNYYGCLNACAEMEATLKDEQWMPYLHYIYDQVPGYREGSYWYENFETQRQVASATAIQRCTAFLHVHGKWRDA